MRVLSLFIFFLSASVYSLHAQSEGSQAFKKGNFLIEADTGFGKTLPSNTYD